MLHLAVLPGMCKHFVAWVILFPAAWVFRQAAANTADCSSSPNCTELRREDCNVHGTMSNVCGNCLEGMHGSLGPTNTKCLANASCALIFSGQKGCPETGSGSTKVPFVVPFDKCICDTDGLYWPTAPGMCAYLEVTMRRGTGMYALKQCRSSSCSPETCSQIAMWSPIYDKFTCSIRGTDSYTLSDGCTVDGGFLPPNTMSALCGHAALTAKLPPGLAVSYPITCELAPRCPESVLGVTRLEETCCQGFTYSHPLTEWGRNEEIPAPGFCSKQQTGMKEEFGCQVRTSAPGWRGCACLDDQGLVEHDYVCTVECIPPDCPLPDGGVRPTPEKWLTSQVPAQLFPPDRSVYLQATNSGSWRTATLQVQCWVLAVGLALLMGLPEVAGMIP
mmetsp:Transcript_68714/g.119378  ORF Transcript_68714/g.119378 Transcript_68714/m.119378 type:complete len:390 (-) Transcript_68714:78-1247(-)